VSPRLKWAGVSIRLGRMEAGQIAAWRLYQGAGSWKAERVDAAA
jgi:hypothetical protein